MNVMILNIQTPFKKRIFKIMKKIDVLKDYD